jgi:hypothetical protein
MFAESKAIDATYHGGYAEGKSSSGPFTEGTNRVL